MKTVSLDSFTVVGIEARTSFSQETGPAGVIPVQWARAMKEGLLDKIPDRTDKNIIALYSDYESNEYGAYSFLICAKVSSIGEVPEGMVMKRVEASQYAVFESPRGPVSQIVYEAWKSIWYEPATAEYSRSYRADFEVYGEQASDPSDSRIEIYVGTK